VGRGGRLLLLLPVARLSRLFFAQEVQQRRVRGLRAPLGGLGRARLLSLAPLQPDLRRLDLREGNAS